jgi:hypothetical protein
VRLLLFWITTEALKTKSPRLELGARMAGFMPEVGLDTGHGGKRSDGHRLQVQMTRLFQARISFMQDMQDGANEGSAWLNMQVSRKGVLWWNPRNPAQGSLWNSWIELERDFCEAITAAPIPTMCGQLTTHPSPRGRRPRGQSQHYVGPFCHLTEGSCLARFAARASSRPRPEPC